MTTDFRSVVASDPKSAGLFLDFDGVLSHIVDIPSEARPLEGVREILTELSQRLGLVAIVSGRGADELLDWLGADVEIWGVHGAVRAVDGRIEVAAAAMEYAALMTRVRDELASRLESLHLEGVILEDKTVMLALHYRNATDPAAAQSALESLTQEMVTTHGVVANAGRSVIELKPPIEFSKADVVRRRAPELGLKAAAFVGDDTVDLPALDALDELGRDGVATARVAVRSDESPEELLQRADEIVDAPKGALAWLRSLL